ncbi:MAG: SprB repeat-containing protein [Bacteroidetes bacterium]|nr:SprB repeat-containing protein [Bacteroidota bacterium]
MPPTAASTSQPRAAAPYAFLWSTGATTEDVSALGAGTYGVTVTDANGCDDQQLHVGWAGDPGHTGPSTFSCGYNVTCNGATNGSINFTATGGCAPIRSFGALVRRPRTFRPWAGAA